MRSELAQTENGERRPWRLLLWAALASLVCGLIGFGEVAEDGLRIARNSLHPTRASGEIVFVGIDDRSVSEVGRWPWNRSIQAELIERAQAAGAERVFVDLIYDSPAAAEEDAALERTLKRSGKRVTLADRAELGIRSDIQQPSQILPRFRQHASTASITVRYNWQAAVWSIHHFDQRGGTPMPSFASEMARKSVEQGDQFRIDYSIVPTSVPYRSASDVLRGKAGDLSGKTVIVGLNADQLGDQFWIPGYGRMAGAYIHIIAAETLMRGRPATLGWWPALLLAIVACGLALTLSPGLRRTMALTATGALLLSAPFALDQLRIYLEVVPALTATLIITGSLAWRRLRDRGLVNEATGLPNLQALRREHGAEAKALIVARIHNHAEISAAVNDHESREVSRQIVSRLTAGNTAAPFQGEDGTFAWLIPNHDAIGNHLEALHSIFRSPLVVGARQIDVALSFGVELGSSRSMASRLASAILAADESWNEGLRWKLHDPSRQEEMNWRVSLLGELDTAIDHGEVWLAYQPQYDMRRGQIVGAEALARWTHPTKGPICPAEFVAAAEANGRIAKLTDFVLDRAIASAAAINRRGVPFQVAVNLSARLLTDRDLLVRVEHMLANHGLPPTKLTLELTETASLQDAESGLATLDALAKLGVRIAIDDYGTGLSTLDYLKKIPANEIKIDQSFIKSMRVNRSDLIMVQSTIALAHSLGRTVVAEGVEDKQCLDDLTEMGCDIAQGFAIGRPMGVRELVQRLHTRTPRRVA